jgi:hypothetical protein
VRPGQDHENCMAGGKGTNEEATHNSAVHAGATHARLENEAVSFCMHVGQRNAWKIRKKPFTRGSGRIIIRSLAKRLRVKIHIHTRTCIHWVLGGYRVHVGFVIPHIKTISK